MKKSLLAFALFSALNSSAQTPFFTEDFESGAPGWTLNVVTGTEGADPNYFTISDNEGGVTPPGCGVATNGNKTLHVTSVFNPTGGAAYDAGGLCGILYCPQTNRRTESPAINCNGHSSIKLQFNFIANGDALNDNASLWYYDGATWAVLTPSLKSPLCGGGQGQWTTYTVTLPPSANNNTNVKIAFGWINNDDGAGTDPSVAINDVQLSSAASILNTTMQSITNVSCFGAADGAAQINVTNAVGAYTCNWNPGTPPGDGTTNVTGLSAGTWTCLVTDSIGQTSTQTFTVTQPAAIDTSVTIGTNTLTANATGATYQWVDCGNNYAAFPGETNQTFTIIPNGNVAVIVTVGACSDTSVCMKINTTGINSAVYGEQNVTLFPNPSDGKFTIRTTSGPQLFQVFDAAGRMVFSKNISGTEQLDLSDLKGGIYNCTIKNISGVLNKRLSIIK